MHKKLIADQNQKSTLCKNTNNFTDLILMMLCFFKDQEHKNWKENNIKLTDSCEHYFKKTVIIISLWFLLDI
jgi:hypothetical protein